MIIVNTGNGKGKTTAAVGQTVRALGQGWRVCFIQLFKGECFHGEQKVLCRLKNFEFRSFAPKHPALCPGTSRSRVEQECKDALESFRSAALGAKGAKRYDLIVLDEFNIAIRDGFILLKEVLDVLDKMDSNTNVLFTGRGAKRGLIARADLVTEMKEAKHPYSKGVKARKGIEY